MDKQNLSSSTSLERVLREDNLKYRRTIIRIESEEGEDDNDSMKELEQ